MTKTETEAGRITSTRSFWSNYLALDHNLCTFHFVHIILKSILFCSVLSYPTDFSILCTCSKVSRFFKSDLKQSNVWTWLLKWFFFGSFLIEISSVSNLSTCVSIAQYVSFQKRFSLCFVIQSSCKVIYVPVNPGQWLSAQGEDCFLWLKVQLNEC